MPRDVDIQPGSTFHLPAAQDKNIDNLLKIFGKKEATDALTAMAKTPPDMWVDISNMTSNLRDIVMAGGLSKMVASLEEALSLKIEEITSPIINEINTAMAIILAPIEEQLATVFNDLSGFIAENPTGGAIGGIVGGVAGLFLPGGQIWGILLALVGAALEAFFTDLAGDIAASPMGISPTGGIFGGPEGFAFYGSETPPEGARTGGRLPLEEEF